MISRDILIDIAKEFKVSIDYILDLSTISLGSDEQGIRRPVSAVDETEKQIISIYIGVINNADNT